MLVGRSVLRRCLNGAFQGMVCDDDEILFEFQAARMHQATNMRNYMTERILADGWASVKCFTWDKVNTLLIMLKVLWCLAW